MRRSLGGHASVLVSHAAILGLVFLTPVASAQSTRDEVPVVVAPTCAPPRCKRAIPEYDGLPPRRPSLGEELLWLPRVIFFPIHLVLEYVIRQPIGWLLTTAEQNQWQTLAFDVFSTADRNVGLVPTAFYDFGFRPSFGGHFWWNEGSNRLRATVGFGGADLWHGRLVDRIEFSPTTNLEFVAEGITRPDQAYFGTGYSANQGRVNRYTVDELGIVSAFTTRPWRASEIVLRVSAVGRNFRDGAYKQTAGEISVFEAARTGLVLPEGFEGYMSTTARIEAALDTRPRENVAPDDTDLNARIAGLFEIGFDAMRPSERSWIRGDFGAGVFLEVPGDRTFSISAQAALVEPLGSLDVPFLDLVYLGDNQIAMDAFIRGRLAGRSSVAATLEYRYSIWSGLDGSAHVSLGNVFGPHFSDFATERLRLSFGVGVRTRGNPDNPFTVIFALGTDTFEQGTRITTVRFVIGTQRGF